MGDLKTEAPEQPAASILVGPSHGEVPTTRCIRVRGYKGWRRNGSSTRIGRQLGGSVAIDLGSCRPGKHPGPIVVLAIYEHIGNDPLDHRRGIEYGATLRLASGGQK